LGRFSFKHNALLIFIFCAFCGWCGNKFFLTTPGAKNTEVGVGREEKMQKENYNLFLILKRGSNDAEKSECGLHRTR
jgi:hypothetical protein